MRLEKWLEGRVERFFGPRESVQPIEIARRMVRAMEEERRISVQRTYVPNAFVVYVSEGDLAELESFVFTLEQDLANHVQAAARRQGFAFPGPIAVAFEADNTLNRGETRVEVQFQESPEGEIDDSEAQSSDTGLYIRAGASASAIEVNMDETKAYRAVGKTPIWRLSVEEGPDEGNAYVVRLPASIGRRQGCDVQLHDPKISRLHARLELDAEGVVVVDADSTNGTRLNGRFVRRATVAPGDRVELGSTRLVIHPERGG
jgi:hypothetical protein